MSIENGGPSEEEMDPDGLTQEERAMAEAMLPLFDELPLYIQIGVENAKLNVERSVEVFENILIAFEIKHSLPELNAITDLTPAEAPNHPIREPARLDLIDIVPALNILEHTPGVSKEKYDELKAKYSVLSKAVGFINNNKVRH